MSIRFVVFHLTRSEPLPAIVSVSGETFTFQQEDAVANIQRGTDSRVFISTVTRPCFHPIQ